MSHGQKYLKTAVLDHLLAWKWGRGRALGLSSPGKALLILRYNLSTFLFCLLYLLTLFCFSAERKCAQLVAFPLEWLHVITTSDKRPHSHGDRSYLQFPVMFAPPSNASIIRKC